MLQFVKVKQSTSNPLLSQAHDGVRSGLLANGLLLLLLLLVIIAGTTAYVSSEHAFYSWDYAFYEESAYGTVDYFHESPLQALRAVAHSMSDDYNLAFTLPILPALLLDRSRLTYELALALIYFFPFSLAIGGIAANVVPPHSRAVFWSAVGLTLLIPMAWVPMLRGLPDVGGALLLSLALWLYTRDPQLKRVYTMIGIALLLTASILFRRHFAYAVVAFFLAAGLVLLIQAAGRIRQGRTAALQELRSSIPRLTLLGVATLIALIVFGFAFVQLVLTHDYSSLYSSFEFNPFVVLTSYIDAYSWVVMLAATIGYLLALATHRLQQQGIFLGIYGVLFLLLWSIVVRQVDWHYTLHFTPVVVVGLTSLAWTAVPRLVRSTRLLFVAAMLLYLICYIAAGLGRTTVANGPLPITSWGPLRRADYGQMANLIAYLRTIAPNREPIEIAAASLVINADLVRVAEQQLYGVDGSILNVLPNPDVDSRGYYPLENLIQAQYIVVVDPFQYHLRVEEQGVVAVMHDLFQGETAFANDFTLLEPYFQLEDGATALTYRRTRPTSLQVALSTLDLIRRYVPARPGNQPEWIGAEIPSDYDFLSYRDGRPSGIGFQVSRPGTLSASYNSAVTLAYLSPLPQKATITGIATFEESTCEDWTVTFSTTSPSGALTNLATADLAPDENDPDRFEVPLSLQNVDYLLMRVSSSAGASHTTGICTLELQVDPLHEEH